MWFAWSAAPAQTAFDWWYLIVNRFDNSIVWAENCFWTKFHPSGSANRLIGKMIMFWEHHLRWSSKTEMRIRTIKMKVKHEIRPSLPRCMPRLNIRGLWNLAQLTTKAKKRMKIKCKSIAMNSIQNGLSNMKTTETWKKKLKPMTKVRFEFYIECDYYIKAMKLVKNSDSIRIECTQFLRIKSIWMKHLISMTFNELLLENTNKQT